MAKAKQQRKRKFKESGRSIISDEINIPNHSGMLDAGKVHSTPVDELDPVNKDYVDSQATKSEIHLFLTENASDIATYFDLEVDIVLAAKENIVKEIPANSTALIAAFASILDNETIDNLRLLESGVFAVHMHAEGAVAKNLTIYAEIYHRTAGGTETLIATTHDSAVLTTSEAEYEVHNTVTDDKAFIAGDRIVLKIYGRNVGTPARNITIYMEGDTASRLELPGLGNVSAGGLWEVDGADIKPTGDKDIKISNVLELDGTNFFHAEGISDPGRETITGISSAGLLNFIAIDILHSATTGRTANDHHNETHASSHETGGGDLLAVENIPTAFTTGSIVFSNGTNLAQDNFNLFWNDAANELEPNLIKITSDGTQAAPALKFNDTNTGFYKSGDSIRLSINNSTIMTVDSTGISGANVTSGADPGHSHTAVASHTIASHSDTTGTGAELDTLTDGSETTLHSHAGGAGSPTGTISMFGSVTPPTGWLLCDGAEVSQTTYAALFAVLGADAYGTDAGGNFFLPSFASAFPRGNTITASGGDDDAINVSHTHTFTGSSTTTGNPSLNHTHTVNPATHRHSQSAGSNLGTVRSRNSNTHAGYIYTDYFDLPQINSGTVSSWHTHTLTPLGSNSTDGASGTDKNIPAFVGVAFIIKT